MGVIKNIIVIILIAGAVILGFRLLTPEDNWICENGTWVQHGKPASPMPQTPCEKSEDKNSPVSSSENEKLDQKEYINTQLGFSVTLPSDIDIVENMDGTISFTKWGPTQKTATELFDGISVNVDQGTLGTNKDLKSLIDADIDQKKEQLSSDFKLTRNIVQIENGFFFQTQEMFGAVDYYYLSQSGDKYLLVSAIQRDPANLGFEKIVSGIISGITIIN